METDQTLALMAELSEGQIAIVCSSPIYHYPYRHPIPDFGLTHNTSTVQREDQRLRHRQRAGVGFTSELVYGHLDLYVP